MLPTQLIHARYTVPVRPQRVVLENYCVAIRDDVILDVLPFEQARAAWPQTEIVELPEHVLIPGSVNAHTHTPMTLMRG